MKKIKQLNETVDTKIKAMVERVGESVKDNEGLKKFKVNTLIFFVSIILCFVLVIAVCVKSVNESRQLANAFENVEYITVIAGPNDGQYYTWWQIATEFCPSYMYISNYEDDGNYLYYLYNANGGHHALYEGDTVIVPVFPD